VFSKFTVISKYYNIKKLVKLSDKFIYITPIDVKVPRRCMGSVAVYSRIAIETCIYNKYKVYEY